MATTPTTNGPAGEVMKRLKDAGITQEAFLYFLSDLDLIDVDRADISAGFYVIGHVPTVTLQKALESWGQVINQLKGQS